MKPEEIQKYLDFGLELAMKAGKIHMKWRPNPETQIKADRTPVTNADKECAILIREEIGASFPDHGIYTEESSETPGNPRWIADEVDGTYPFSRGYSDDFCFNLAFEENGVLLFGITYAPAKNLLYQAVLGRGASCNGHVISGSLVVEPPGAVIYIGSGKKAPISDIPFVFKAYDLRMLHVRTGCHGMMLAYAAEGKIDAFLATDAEIEDIASAAILAEEAGLKLTNRRGEPWTIRDRFCLAANPVLHARLSSAFRLPIR